MALHSLVRTRRKALERALWPRGILATKAVLTELGLAGGFPAAPAARGLQANVVGELMELRSASSPRDHRRMAGKGHLSKG